ncbi:Alpha/Beta hydrolase protein [Mycena capillaripes]|nr:Alpha/Beta hydrolase protein [Mycena capillaripes]
MATVTKLQYISAALSIVWAPYIDGDVIVRHPLLSVSRGLYANDSDDEGTVFSFGNMNITTDAEFLEYVHSNYLPATTLEQIAQIGELYPDDPTQGSPLDTGTNAVTPEFKRLAAFQGDLVLMGPRRFFLEQASKTQNAWSWMNKRGKDIAPIGAFRASDVPIWFPANTTSETVGVDALINFINTLDPNQLSKSSTLKPSIFWPKWNTPSPAGFSLSTFTDAGINITADSSS